MSIRKMLDMSSGHLTRTTRELLDEWASPINHAEADVSTCPALMGITDFGGIMIATEQDKENSYPADLIACFYYAQDLGCDFILFVHDGDHLLDLPFYD